jgi:8-oxo-dGTP diphosphatase
VKHTTSSLEIWYTSTMSERFTYIGSSYLFLIKDNKILLQRRFQTGFMDGYYGVPAGHLDGGETAREGCAREIKEEIGVDINPEDLKVVHVMHRKAEKDERIDFFMTTTEYSKEIRNCEPDKCDDLKWFNFNELPDNMVDYVKVALENYRNNINYSEFGY